MNPALVISILVASPFLAGIGAYAGLWFGRHGRGTNAATVDRLAMELAGRQQAQVDGVVERVVSIAGESFDSRLQTGTVELDLRRAAIEQQVEHAFRALTEKVESVDKLVTEKVGGISDTVGERVGGMSKQMGQQVHTMNAELTQLRLLVTQLQKERAQQHGQFVESLEAATRQQKQLAETTGHLRDALASPQARGQWGERMAEDVLRSAGMREGVNYRKQKLIEGGTKPDFTFLLPDDNKLHMDVKFPVTNYLRYLEAPSDTEAAERCDRFLRDVRDRVKELNGRGYAASDSTLGYLLLFIPNESVYGFIHENDSTLLDDALAQQVVLCSPTTLFAVLGVIRQAMDAFAVERASEEIVQCLAGFGEQWRKFSEQIDKVDRHLDTLTRSFGDLSGTRRRQLERQLDRIDDVRSRNGVDDESSVLGQATLPALREVTDRSAG
ncbi:MAG: DNA recombination protein RmuC [Acidimicrobiales bacterium]|nr:DNA recombination protein RmuC [Acidimicrobiales bacterium]